MLDNPDFKINQRHLTYYTGSGYTIDRWRNESGVGSIEVIENGLLLKSRHHQSIILYQQIENPLPAGEYTLSFKYTSDTSDWCFLVSGVDYPIPAQSNKVYSLTFTAQEAFNKVYFWHSGTAETEMSLEWVKLELGTIATPFISPNPATELLKCQRYLQPLMVSRKNDGWYDADHSINANFNLKPQMRVAPTVLNPECLCFDTEYGMGAWQHTGEFTFDSNPVFLDIHCVVPEDDLSVLSAYRMFSGKVGYDGQKDYLWLSAEL